MLNRGFSIVVRGIGHWLEIVYRVRRVTGGILNRGVIKFGIEIVSVMFHRSKRSPPIFLLPCAGATAKFLGIAFWRFLEDGVGLLLRILQHHLLARLREDPKLFLAFAAKGRFFWNIFQAGSAGTDYEHRIRIHLSPEMKADFSSLFPRDAPQNGRLWFEAWIVVLELSKRHCRNTDNETAKHSRIGIGARLQNVKVAIFQVFAHTSGGYILNVTICQIQV